jgi:hypothetical protein
MYTNKEAKKYNGSDNEITEVDAVIEEVRRELRSLLVKTDEQIKKIGNALKKVVKREESICEEIKIALKEEIAEDVISTRTIELHCPQEWKRKTKPKQRENEKISFSKQVEDEPQHKVAMMQGGKSVTIDETQEGSGGNVSSPQPEQVAETGVDISPRTSTSDSQSTAVLLQQEKAASPQPDSGTGTGSVNQQPVCESCLTKDAKIMELEEAQKNLKAIYPGIGNHIEASSAHHTTYNRFDNSELSAKEKQRDDHRKCKNCEILQQKYEQLQSKLQGYEEVVRTHTSIKTAKELYRSTDGYQQFEFSVPFEPLRQHMIAAFNSNRSVNSIWFTGKFNDETGDVVDILIGKITDTNTTQIKQQSKTSVVLKDDTSNDITGN